MPVAVGDTAPDFTLEGTVPGEENHRNYSLSELRGQNVVLVFYPADNSPVCTSQLNTYSSEIEMFRNVGANVLALSPQKLSSHDGFIERQGGFEFPLLADLDKKVGDCMESSGRSVFTAAACLSWMEAESLYMFIGL